MPFLPLHEVRQPLLVLAGGDDQFARLPDVRAMVDTLPAGRLRVFRDAGHFLLNDLRHDAVGAIAQFLQVRGDPMPATPRQTCAGATPSFHSTESTP
jgi:pimeloyl-ACP methyl ester carboxylesterase